MTTLKRGMIIDVDLNPTKGPETGKVRPCVIVTNNVYNERVPVIQVVPITGWSEKKGLIKTNVELMPTSRNGLSKKSVADCLQTRPIDHRQRCCPSSYYSDLSVSYGAILLSNTSRTFCPKIVGEKGLEIKDALGRTRLL